MLLQWANEWEQHEQNLKRSLWQRMERCTLSAIKAIAAARLSNIEVRASPDGL